MCFLFATGRRQFVGADSTRFSPFCKHNFTKITTLGNFEVLFFYFSFREKIFLQARQHIKSAAHSVFNHTGKVIGNGINLAYPEHPHAQHIYNGTHEIHIGYQMELNLTKKGKNKHQSVRWL